MIITKNLDLIIVFTTGKIGGGYIDDQTAIAVSQLAFKHRVNKNFCRRIIIFTGSPLDVQETDEHSMVKVATRT